jgi:hypothetical protein
LNPQIQPANAKIRHFANKTLLFHKKRLDLPLLLALDGSVSGFQRHADQVKGPGTREPKPTKHQTDKNMRINIPSNPDALIKLAKAILANHTALGVASPLNGIDGIAAFQPQVNAADANNDLAGNLYKQAEKATETRDKALGPNATTPGYVRFFVISARDVLAGLNKGSEHKLGDWGFEVDASPQPTPAAKAAAKAAKAAKPAN